MGKNELIVLASWQHEISEVIVSRNRCFVSVKHAKPRLRLLNYNLEVIPHVADYVWATKKAVHARTILKAVSAKAIMKVVNARAIMKAGLCWAIKKAVYAGGIETAVYAKAIMKADNVGPSRRRPMLRPK